MNRIFDCFTFFNEFECLEMRLGELGDVVDGFVLVEAALTHSGQPKPWYYMDADRSDRKVLSIQTDGSFREPVGQFDANWQREHAQRNAIMQGLLGFDAKDDDIAIIGDADEILSADAVRSLRGSPLPCTFMPVTTYYAVNLIFPCELRCPMAATVGWLRQHSPQALRGPNRDSLRLAPGKAWHLSYLGGVERIRTKIQSFAHQELNSPEVTDLAFLQKCVDERIAYQHKTPLRHVPIDLNALPRGFDPVKHAHLVC